MARLSHMWASTSSCGTPLPLPYITPRLNCAETCPSSAASRYPPCRFGIVLQDAFAFVVRHPEAVLRLGRSLVGRKLVPPCCLGMVLWDAFALVIHHPEVELPLGIPLVGRKAKPSSGLGIVLWDGKAIRIHHSNVALRRGMSLVGSEAIPPQGLRGILGDTLAGVIEDPQAELGLSIALLGKDAGQRIGRFFACAEAEQQPACDGRAKSPADHSWHVTSCRKRLVNAGSPAAN